MTIYLDMIFIENLIINYLILYIISKLLKVKVKRQKSKLILSALIGGFYCLASILFFQNQFFLIKIIISIIMIYIAFTPKKLKEFLKYITFFYLITFTTGGTMLALICTINNKKEIISENGFTIKNSFEIIIISIVIVIYLVKKAFNFKAKEINNKNIICKIIIYINNKCIKTKGLIDSGNLLLDPITQQPVIVLEAKKLTNIIPKKDLEKIINIVDKNDNFNKIKNIYKERIRIIPYKSIGEEKGFMVGIKSDKVKIITEYDEIIKNNIVIALYNKMISQDNKYSALIGINILKENS